MNKKFTNEEVVKAAHCCTKNDCKTCPFIVLGAGFKLCHKIFRIHSKQYKKRACTCGNRHKLGGIKRYQFNTP